MTKLIDAVNRFVWGVPALVMILGVGLLISFRTGFVQVRLFPKAFHSFLSLFRKRSKENTGTSSFQALCTALGATVGTGNLVGVAGAICIGGPGSIFWMWICGFVGMATKFAEVTLSVHYRQWENDGWTSGPMQIIVGGLGSHRMAKAYAVLCMLASYGVGNATQINAVISSFRAVTGEGTFHSNLLLGILLGLLSGAVLLGGAKRIGTAAERLVPLASAGYMLLCAGVLVLRHSAVPSAFSSIIRGAFFPRAVTGGVVGTAMTALRTGCARGVFTNEAGMGTASIAHGAADVKHPVQQGQMGMMEVFLDTIVICTLTALVILSSGVPIPYGTDSGTLTSDAFCLVYGSWAGRFLVITLCCFAFATILGWGYYGGKSAEFLFGPGAWRWFAVSQGVAAVFASVLGTGVIWTAAEAVNGLMAIPNLLTLAVLCPELRRLTIDYQKSGL